MRITEKRRRVVEEDVAIQCDKCGQMVEVEDVCEYQEMLSVSFTGGYAAVLGDGETYMLDLCQHCVKDLLGPYLRKKSDEREGVRRLPGNGS